MTRTYSYALQLPILLVVAVTVCFFFTFTAEDAYITYRYAENLVTTGSLVYNVGEPINAMTSPLHAWLSAALFAGTGQTVLGNKLLALLLLLVSGFLVWHRYRNSPQWQPLALILVLMPPAILLWTFGGLETPLLLFLATLTVCLADHQPSFSLGRLCGVFVLAGLAFLTRYDAILFLFPLVLHAALKARSVGHLAVAMVVAAVLPGAWFTVSLFYYGDLLPTSFYVKTPSANWGTVVSNAKYIAAYLFYVGALPGLALALVLVRPKHALWSFVASHFKSLWWLYLGLVLELLYGLTMATHHMMFSFRFFVPYLPSTAIIVVDLVRRASETRAADFSSRRTASLLAGCLGCFALFQLYQTVYTYQHSVNGLSTIGEYRSVGIRDYNQFLQILKQAAGDIEQHWAAIKVDTARRPRILTFAGGMLPYEFRESYIYEQLVSYRHCYQRQRQGLHADYLHILAPRHGTVAQQLPKPEAEYTLISAYEMTFDGSPQRFLVYYNSEPEPNNLSASIHGLCQRGDLGTSFSAP